ncbi:hypothetical protein GCM10011341_38690 [Frigidibacter albus]|nr:hypothetical protein GCM10011341_38690 [Frigidibacter albus]
MVAPMEPVCAPDPVETPAKAFQHILTKSVPFTRPKCRVIGSPIALDRHDVLGGPIRVARTYIYPETSGSDLEVCLVA